MGLNKAAAEKLENTLRELNIEITEETRKSGAGVRWIVRARQGNEGDPHH